MAMESLVGTKVWLNNDPTLIRQVEQFAFKNGFGWLESRYNTKNSSYEYKTTFKPTKLKLVYSLYFLESKTGLKFISYRTNYKKVVNSYFSHKNRFDEAINNSEHYDCSKNIPLKEVSVQDLLKNENNWLWNL